MPCLHDFSGICQDRIRSKRFNKSCDWNKRCYEELSDYRGGDEMKVLDTTYHTQVNNAVLPYVTCGTTSLANTLNWLNKKFNQNFECDDDKVFQILNSPEIIEIAENMIKRGEIDKSALEYRIDNIKTVNIDESKFTHLNNFKQMLVTVANYITKVKYNYQLKYLSQTEIKRSLDHDFPIIISGKFTPGGHFIPIVGYDDDQNWISDDPYGNWNRNYAAETIGKGAKVFYDINKMDKIITSRQMIDGVICYEVISIHPGLVNA